MCKSNKLEMFQEKKKNTLTYFIHDFSLNTTKNLTYARIQFMIFGSVSAEYLESKKTLSKEINLMSSMDNIHSSFLCLC